MPRGFVEKRFEEQYEKGFLPLEPIVNPNNTILLEKITSKKKLKAKNTNHIDISNLIGDKDFAAFINGEGEIIVNGSLYKFTPKGLFFGDLNDSIKIRKTAIKTYKTASKLARNVCEYRETEGGIRQMEPEVFRYIAPIDESGCGGGGYSGGGSSGSGSSSTITNIDAKTSEIALNNIIQNLRTVTKPDDNWFQNIFGTYKYAHEYFKNRDYRFEIDYWNQKWLIYRSLGVEAETHKKGWFWWNNVFSDEMILGINKVLLEYKLPQPDLSFYQNYTSNILSQYMQQPLYMHNGRFMIENTGGIYESVKVKVLNNNQLPFFKYKGKNVLNIYLGKIKGKPINFNVLSQSNVKELYKLGIQFLEKLDTVDKPFVVTVQATGDKIKVLFFDDVERKYIVEELEKKFDSDWAFTIGGKYTDTGSQWSSNYNYSGVTGSAFDYLGKYTHKEIDVYGLARRGNEWRGLRLLYK